MKELNNLFVEDDLDAEEVNEGSKPNSPKETDSNDKDKNNDDLEDLLETTAEDSLMDVPKIQQTKPLKQNIQRNLNLKKSPPLLLMRMDIL